MSNQKNKLFIPRKQSGEDSKWNEWNKKQPVKNINGKDIRINQYDEDGKKQGYWEKYYSNGNISSKGSYIDDKMEGYWYEYGDKGQYLSKNKWVNSKLVFESENKKKLFIPRKLSKGDNRHDEWNNSQPIKTIDGKEIRINQYDEDGLKQGYWEEYHPDNNQLFRKGWFKDNKENGVWESYYINGYLHTKGEYKNGLRNGIWFIYDITGKLKTKGEYDMGKIIKVAKPYSITESKNKLFIPRRIDERFVDWNNMQPIIDGERINQYDLKTGNPTGRWGQGDKYMGDTTDLFETIYGVFADDFIDEDLGKDYVYYSLIDIIKNDLYETLSEEGPLSFFHYDLTIPLDSKEVKDRFEYLYNISYKQFMGESKLFIPRKLSGEENRYLKWNKKQPIIDGIQINQYDENGLKQGLWIERDNNGRILSKMEWKDNYVNGEYKTFYPNGQIQYDGQMKNGEFNGLWKMYYINGQLKEIGEYVDSKFNGLWKWYYPFNNQLEQFVNYVDGRPDGLSIEYFMIGKIKSKNIYNKGKKIAYISYNENGDMTRSMNWSDEYDNMVIKEQMENKDKILKSFEPQKELNSKIWDENGKLKKKIKDTLIAIGQEFYKTLEVDSPIKDIIFTGSLANYNWSQYSDIDLHVLMDFNEFDDKELIKKYFDAKKAIWNDNHNIKIKGYDVELYAQDIDEPHESSGIYSVMKDEWEKKPRPQEVKIDRDTIKKKVKQFETEYSRIIDLYKGENYQETKKALDKIKDKIKKYRKAGLDKGGEMSTENLVFKTMRRSGLMDKIYKLGIETTDKEYTIEVLDESKKLIKKQSGSVSKTNDSNEDNNGDILKNFKKNIGMDVGFLASFGAGINALIRNISSLIKEYSVQPLNTFEMTNLAIAMIVVYIRKGKTLKDFKNEMLSIAAFTSLMPAYNDIINSLLGNVDFMDAFMTIIKSAGVYMMLSHFKGK